MTHGRALGDADYKDPKPFVSAEASVRRLDLLPEDKAVIIASDGLWDVIGDQDVVTMVDQLIQVCNLAGRQYACFGNTVLCLANVDVIALELAIHVYLPLSSFQQGVFLSNATAQHELQTSKFIAATSYRTAGVYGKLSAPVSLVAMSSNACLCNLLLGSTKHPALVH